MTGTHQFDAVVIGAGHAGMAMSYWLRKIGSHHVVLERGRVGHSWASQRWDSFFLNTINSINLLPGDTYEGSSPTGFPSRDEFVKYLRNYRARHELPVRENVEVTRVTKATSGFEIEAAGERLSSRTLVLCSGDQNTPTKPPAAAELPSDLLQLHAAEYRTPEALPAGAVLVVGSGQSGVQVVEDLVEAGRDVYLCTSKVGRIPRRYRGRDVLEWMLLMKLGEQRPEDVQDPAELTARQPQISGTKGGHAVSCHQLARDGVTLLGRFEGAEGRKLRVAGDLLTNVAAGDQQSAKIRGGIDLFIEKFGVDAPDAEPDPVDAPFEDLQALAERRTLDLDDATIRTVIFCTGYGARFDYLDRALLDERGRPRHRDGVCQVPGLYCVGFTWLRRRFSGLVHGAAADAEHIASLIDAGAVH